MRRWVVVAAPAVLKALAPWLEGLRGVEAIPREQLALTDLEGADGAWVHDLTAPAEPLRAFAERGGRVLLTLEAVRVAHAMGLLAAPPVAWRGTGWAGHATLTTHPLLDGMLGAVVTSTSPGGWRTAASHPPGARVVARSWSGGAPDPGLASAWEHEVGAGGVLCIGAHADPRESDDAARAGLLALLANALEGHAVPHADRPLPAGTWPAPGHRVHLAAGAVAAVPSPGPLPDEAAERPSGRRLWVLGDALEPGEAWALPYRLMDAVMVERGRGTGLVVPLELPVLIWEVEPDAEGVACARWLVDLAMPDPLPEGSLGDLHVVRAPDGSAVRLTCDGAPFVAQFSLTGEGTFEVTPLDGRAAVQVRLSARGRVQLLAIGASAPDDMDRTAQALARRGSAGLVAQWNQHREQLRRFHHVELPHEALAQAFVAARHALDGLLAGVPGVGRSQVEGPPRRVPGDPVHMPRLATVAACQVATAQLAAGDHGCPRDTLKFLATTLDPSGQVVARCTLSGLPAWEGTAPGTAFLAFAGEYAAWTADLEGLRRAWPALRRAFEYVATRAPEAARSVVAGLEPVAEALGFPDLAEEFSQRAVVRGASAPGGEPGEPLSPGELSAAAAAASDGGPPDAAVRLVRLVMGGLWGIVPSALTASAFVTPRLPAGWDAMGLERLRIGRSMVTLRLRRRGPRTTLHVERVHGPLLHLRCRLGDRAVHAATVDDIALGTGEARFEASGRHVLTFDHE